MDRRLFLRAVLVNEFDDEGVDTYAQKWYNHPNVALVEVVNLYCRQHENVYQRHRGPEGAPHLVLHEAPIELDHEQEPAQHGEDGAD